MFSLSIAVYVNSSTNQVNVESSMVNPNPDGNKKVHSRSAGSHTVMTPSCPEYTKTPPQKCGSSYILIEKSPKTPFSVKPLTRYNSNTFCEE